MMSDERWKCVSTISKCMLGSLHVETVLQLTLQLYSNLGVTCSAQIHEHACDHFCRSRRIRNTQNVA